jgi:hypothetical protein
MGKLKVMQTFVRIADERHHRLPSGLKGHTE